MSGNPDHAGDCFCPECQGLPVVPQTHTPPVSDEAVEAAARAIAFSYGGKICGPGQSIATRELGWKPDHSHMDKYVEIHWREHIHAAEFALTAAAPFTRGDGDLRKALEEIAAFGTEDAPYRNIEDAILIAYRGLDAADNTLTMPGSPDCQTRRMALEEAAKIAENVRGGYTANVRIDESEQELIPDPDGPWVLNSAIAKAIRALAAQDAPGKDAS